MFTARKTLTRAVLMLSAALGMAVAGNANASVNPPPASNTAAWPVGDAVSGKVLYDTPTGGLAGPSCGSSSCHGPAVNMSKKLGSGSNKPWVINSAILNGTMTNTWLKAMTAQQLSDVAAFIANPTVTAPSSAPKAGAAPASVAFASTAVGATSATQTVTLSNSGTAPLSLVSIASNNAAFRVSGGTCAAGGSVAAGASCTVSLAFSPTAAGAATATLTFTHNASPTTTTVALSGTGATAAAPLAGAAPASVSFPSTNVGATSAPQTVTLSNTGTAALALSAVSSSNAVFAIGGGTCVAGGSIAAGSNCTLTLTFKPTAAGAASATVTFTHNASPATSTVSLAGAGVAAAPTASLTPTALSFSQVLAGTSSNQTVTLSNTGAAPLTIGTITFAGAQAAEFGKAAASTCANGSSVAPGANCNVLVNFTPTAAGARTASLSVTHNATGSPSTVALNGTGTTTPQPVIAVNNNALGFTDQALGSTSASQTVTVSNAGQAALVLSAVSLVGANAADYALGGTCAANLSVAVNASCTVTVAFAPKALGARAASVALASNAAPVTLSLTGSAVAAPAPALTLTPASQDFGVATVGAAAVTRTVTVANNGTAALSLSSVAVTGAGFSGTNDCGTSVAAGASCTLTLAFAPGSAAALAGQASIVSNAAGSPHTVALNGTGVLAAVAVLSWTGAPAAAFADTSIGAVSMPATLTLTNQGPGSATLNSITTAGANASEFLTGGSCVTGASLAANANCTVTVALSPAQAGPRAATLAVATNGTAPAPVALSGNGVMAAQQLLGVSTTSISFPPAAQGDAVTPMPVTLTNTGTSPVTVTALTLTSSAFTASPATGSLPATLAPAQALSVNVALNAGSAGTGDLTDTLTVVTDQAGLSRTLEVRASVSAGNGASSGAGQTPANSNVGAGGCSLGQPGSGFDPMLALLCLLALAVLWRRRQPR